MSRSPRPPEGHWEDPRRLMEEARELKAEVWRLRRQKSAMGREIRALKAHGGQKELPLRRAK